MTSDTGGARRYQSARRAEVAEDTRARIRTAAVRLFVDRGYGKVTVNDIAHEAGVAVPTVYASTGGKSAILAAVIEDAVRDPVVDATLSAARRASDPMEVLEALARGVRVDNERYHDIIAVNLTAAAVDETASNILARSNRIYRAALAATVPQLRAMGALLSDFTDQQAADILWFYFGHQAWRSLIDEMSWTWDEAEVWLCKQAAAGLLKPR